MKRTVCCYSHALVVDVPLQDVSFCLWGTKSWTETGGKGQRANVYAPHSLPVLSLWEVKHVFKLQECNYRTVVILHVPSKSQLPLEGCKRTGIVQHMCWATKPNFCFDLSLAQQLSFFFSLMMLEITETDSFWSVNNDTVSDVLASASCLLFCESKLTKNRESIVTLYA